MRNGCHVSKLVSFDVIGCVQGHERCASIHNPWSGQIRAQPDMLFPTSALYVLLS